MDDTVEIFLIRHAKSEANRKHMFGSDEPLSFEGKSQIISAREKYQSIAFDKVYCSCLRRTRQTAVLLFGKPVPKERQLAEFNEIHFGDADGKTEFNGQKEEDSYEYQKDLVGFLEACHGDNPYERADIAIAKLQAMANEITTFPQVYPNKRIAIVTSDTLTRCIIQTLKYGHDWRGFSDVAPIQNLGYLRFSYDDTLVNTERGWA